MTDLELNKIKDKTVRTELGVTTYEFVQLLKQEDPEYIKTIVEDREQIEFMGLSQIAIIDLIIGLNDVDYIKSVIENKEKRENIGLNKSDVLSLIERIRSREYIKEIIESKNMWDKIGLDEFDIVRFIKWLQEPNYVKDLIENKEKMAKSGFKPKDIFRLLTTIEDNDYLKGIIENKEKRIYIGLDERYTILLIAELKDKEYINSILFDKEKKKKIRISNESLFQLLDFIDDPEYIKCLLEDKDRLDQFGIDIELVKKIKDELEAIDRHSYEYIEGKNKIKLPPEITIGIEIESEGKNSGLIRLIMDSMNFKWRKFKDNLSYDKWNAVADESINEGVEIVTPILTSERSNSSNDIGKICNALKEFGQTVSDNCGGHIHIGANYLSTKQSWINLLEIWGNAERILYLISNESCSLPRIGIQTNAKAYSGVLEEILNNEMITLNSKEDVINLAKKVQNDDRYFSINFLNANCYKNTIEFRMPNGTLSSDAWIENINLFGGIIKAAEEIAKIQAKSEGERTELERITLEYFEKLRNNEMSDSEKLNCLLSITIPEEDKKIYIDRYETNAKLLKNNQEIQQILEHTAKKKIDIRTIAERNNPSKSGKRER